jgi:glycine dehydrogenase subunit 1
MRYLPLTDADRKEMLAAVGVANIDALFADVPAPARLNAPLDLPRHQPEMTVEAQLNALAGKNVSAGSVPFFCGAGAYRHHIPASVDHLIQRSEFLTSYTPYQPEISQGTLQYLFEFQTQVAVLTGMDVANASMYDGSTACAEAVLMAHRLTRRKKALLSGCLHPHYRDVVETISRYASHDVAAMPPRCDASEDLSSLIDEQTSCVVVQYPDIFGNIADLSALAEAAHHQGALLIVVVTEIVSLGILRPPGEMGADIVVCEGQSLGIGLNFGGPYVGLFATREKFVRQMPGRLSGETKDADDRRGFVLTLSTREQHIRREHATSNICTNSGLCCLAFTIHLALLGDEGLRRLATLNHTRACALAGRLEGVRGITLLTPYFFNEFTLRLPRSATEIVEELAQAGILCGVPGARLWPGQKLDDLLLVAVTETATEEHGDQLVDELKKAVAS